VRASRRQLAFLVDEERVFTGDTLFRGSVGGTRGPGHGTFDELQHSIMDVLMALPKATVVHPGHLEPTTIGEVATQPVRAVLARRRGAVGAAVRGVGAAGDAAGRRA
jgi:glyoxylase-like metal-dependent hydrolase (beta-lactamase superfamily II)